VWSMLNAVRRGPASIAKKLLSPSPSRPCTKLNAARIQYYQTPRPQSGSAVRTLSTTSLWRRYAAVREKAYEIEEEIEDEVNSQQPSSDAQINEASKFGPVTRFKELSERGMVCNTVVNILTQKMGLETMTQVQSLTINETLKGIDV